MRIALLLCACGGAHGLSSAVVTVARAARPILDRTPPWFFTYADLRPYDEASAEARLFLATNVGYAVTGGAIATFGADPALGALCECATAGSLFYHSTQCQIGGTDDEVVQLAILVDYAFAIPSLLVGLAYALQLGDALPVEAVALAVAAFAGLVAGWVWDGPKAYMVLHGCWHIFGAAAGYKLALAHAALAP